MNTFTEQNVHILPSPDDRLVVSATYPYFTPGELFDYWVQPDLLRRWWVPEPEVHLAAGGSYVFRFPQLGQTLRGIYTAILPGEVLAFTWHWDHDGGSPTRQVEVSFQPQPEGGTSLILTHSLYTEAQEDQIERQGHAEGWLHFLQQLQALQGGE